MQNIYLPRAELRAMLHLAAKKDVRFYLNAVFIEATRDRIRMTATDGSALGTFRHKLPVSLGDTNELDAETWAGIVPRETLEAMPAKGTGYVTLAQQDAGTWRLDDGAAFLLIDATFPDYRALFAPFMTPETCPDEPPAIFDPAILARFQKWAKTAGHRNGVPALRQQAGGSALVQLAGAFGHFAGIIMPVRTEAPDPRNLAWAAEPMIPEPEAKPEPERDPKAKAA